MKEDTSDGRDEKTTATDAVRKPYETPSLRVFGDIAELTRTRSNVGNTDGGSGSKKKTG